MVIQARSRIDTWQRSSGIAEANKTRVFHRPIQVDARSRIDTWQTVTSRRRAHSATEV